MSAHTPAPWWVTDSGVRDRGGYIAHTNPVQHYEGQDERYAFEVAQREADKHLIAAAPELLEALRVLLEAIDGNHVTTGDYNQAHHAIAKAEGRS